MNGQKTKDYKTTCEHCVFAEWINTGDKLMQSGCEFGRLDKFREKSLTTEHVSEDGISHFNVINTFCNTCRDKETAERYENPLEDVRKEVTIQPDIIIFHEDHVTTMQILDTLSSIVKMSLTPKKVYIIVHDKNINCADLFDIISEILLQRNIKFDIVRMIDNKSVRYQIDHVVKKVNNSYYSTFKAGNKVEHDFITKIDRFINEDLRMVSMIDAPLESGLTIQTLLHRTVYGNNTMNVEDKIKELADEQNQKPMVVEWTENQESQ